MRNILTVRQTVVAEITKLPCEIEGLLGEGGQGETYRVKLGGASLALKWYHPQWATARQRAALETLIRKGSPSEMFLWPIDLASAAGVPGFGYLMPLRTSRFKSGNELAKRRIEPNFRTLITAGLNLAHGFLQLHAKGLAYRDINFGNFFVDPDSGEVLICDNDNVGIDGQPHNDVGGTMKFMAPEVVRGETAPTAQTDLYSMAVLLHFLFMMAHPLDGQMEAMIECMGPLEQQRLYGLEPVYIADPQDKSNRPVRGRHDNMLAFWPIYPRFFQKHFQRAFGEGIKDPGSRVKESEWRAALVQLRDSLVYCSHCRAENFWSEEYEEKNRQSPSCWACKKALIPPMALALEKQRVMLNYDTRLFSHHLDMSRIYDFSQPVAEVSQHPTNPNIWGLKNLGSNPWKVTLADGHAAEVAVGRSVTLSPGNRINFGNIEGEIQVLAK
jgi:DNA-binding helix-hairpin-helix protein with protein kinase domain